MAKRNNSGKGKEPFDLNNLERAKKLINEIYVLAINTTAEFNKTRDYEKYEKHLTELRDLYTQLEKIYKGNEIFDKVAANSNAYEIQAIHMSNIVKRMEKSVDLEAQRNIAVQKRMKELTAEEEQQKRITKEQEKQAKEEERKLKRQENVAKNFRKNLLDRAGSFQQSGLSFNLNNLGNEVFGKKLQQVKMKDERKQKEIISETLAKFSDEEIANNPKKVENAVSKALEKDFKPIFSKWNLLADTLNVAGKMLQTGVKEFTSLFKTGMSTQQNAFKTNATSIAVMSGITVDQQREMQRDLNNILGSWTPYSNADDLRDNVRTSEIIDEVGKLTEKGFTGASTEELYTQAIDDIVTKKIVPYLDTTSVIWQQLSLAQPELQKNIRGINRVNQEIAGNNYATSKVLDQVLSDLQPMSQYAEDQLAMSAAGATTAINTLMQAGMSEEDAIAQYKKTYKQRTKGADLLKNGTTAEKMEMFNILTSGIDVTDSTNIGAQIASNLKTDKSLSDLYGGSYNSGTMQAMITNIGDNALFGGDLSSSMYFGKGGNLENFDFNLIEQNVKEAQENISKTSAEETENFTKGLYQTAEEKQDIYMENLTNEINSVYEGIGHWGDVLNSGLSAIKDLIALKLIGGSLSGISKVLGTSSGGSSIMSALGPAGAIAGAVVAGAAAIKFTYNKAKDVSGKENEKDISKADMSIRGAAEEKGISVGEESLNQAGSNMYNSTKNFMGVKFSNGQAAELFGADFGIMDALGSGLSVKDFDQTLDKSTENTDVLAYNKAKIGKALIYGGIGTDNADLLSDIAKAWMIGLYSKGYQGTNEDIYNALADTLNIGSFTPDSSSIESLMNGDNALTRSQFENVSKILKDADMWLWNKNGKWVIPETTDYDKVLKLGGIDKERVDYLNSHRQGLSEVPYDNYPAMLHEGEAVLTASTTNELRNLIDEYRETSSQSVNLDMIIQNQTTALVDKMQEIIQTISNTNSITETSALDNPSRQKLKNSMRKMQSTKAF